MLLFTLLSPIPLTSYWYGVIWCKYNILSLVRTQRDGHHTSTFIAVRTTNYPMGGLLGLLGLLGLFGY